MPVLQKFKHHLGFLPSPTPLSCLKNIYKGVKGNLQTCDHSCVLMLSINMGLLQHETMFCSSVALWLLLSKSCFHSHFRPLLVLASGSQLHDFFTLQLQNRGKQILSGPASAGKNKDWLCSSDLPNRQQYRSDLRSLMIPGYIGVLQIILWSVIICSVFLAGSTQFCGA